jgi:CHAD domain-containing protein
MLAAEAGTRAGEDVEDLHRMRVATRRMRAAWRVFEGAYRPRLERRYVRELRDVATALGVVRDLDVLLEDLAAHAAGQPDAGREALQPLRADWQAQRETARDRLIALLDSKQYRDFVEDYLDFVETPGAGERGPVAGRPVLVRDTAGSRILAAYEHVRAYQTTIAWADLPTLHALRIEGKRLRYTLEYFAEVLPPPAEQLIAEVTAMQDHLGLLNDAHVAAGLIRAWLQTNAARIPSASVQAVGTYLESREATMRRLRRTFGPVWRRVIGRSFRRRLGLAIAAIE